MNIVYRYGLRPPIENADAVYDELHRGRWYRRMHVRIHRAQRDAERAAVEAIPAVVAAMAHTRAVIQKVIDCEEAVKAEHIKARAREHSDANAAALEQARNDLKKSFEKLYDARKEATERDDVKAEFARVRGLGADLRRLMHTFDDGRWWGIDHGPWWGTYLILDAAAEQSTMISLPNGKRIPMPLWDGLDPRDPHFSDAHDVVGVGIQTDNRPRTADFVRIDPGIVLTHPGKPKVEPPSAKRQARYRVLTLRVGMKDRRTPIFAKFPMIFDRDLPEGAEITMAKVLCYREGPKNRWEAHISVSVDSKVVAKRDVDRDGNDRAAAANGAVAVDIGWRVRKDELRVCRWFGEGMRDAGELRLNARIIESLTKGDSIRSIRDRHFNEALGLLTDWLATRNANELPEWFVLMTKGLALWQRQGKLAMLVMHWLENRFDGDDGAILGLEWWRRKDKHLWHYESAQRSQALARREDFYRNFAAQLARKFSLLVLENFDLRTMQEAPDLLEGETEQAERARKKYRRIACTHELRDALKWAFVSRHGAEAVRFVDPEWSTHECPNCATITEFDAARGVMWNCSNEKCDHTWDQDDSAARVLLGRRELSGDDVSAGTARKNEKELERHAKKDSRWSRRKQAKKDRPAEAAAPLERRTRKPRKP